MKTKIIAMMLVIVLAVLALAACGTTTPGGNTGNNNPGNNPGGGPGNNLNNPGGDTQDKEYDWDTTTLVYEMSDNSNEDELPSTCKRFLAGGEGATALEKKDWVSNIDDLVKDRNEAAEEQTKVDIIYKYCANTKEFGWGQNIDRIHSETTQRDPNRSDIYCNFVYDMVSASLKGAFSNVLQQTDDNYFMFKDWDVRYGSDEPGFENDDEHGYMHEYMRSLTLSKTKMYCVSSDYFTDMVRAFLVVPVNVTMMNNIGVSADADQFNSDRTGDGKFDINDFYKLVDEGKWTYNAVAAFADAVYRPASDSTKFDGTYGFALATDSGLSASGMLYTSSVPVINKQYDGLKSEYTYNYIGTTVNNDGTINSSGMNTDLTNFAQALYELFSKNGIAAVGSTENSSSITDLVGQKTDLLAIRQRFSENKVLFGGVICLGSLEYENYKTMQASGLGYGIAPVPLYRENDSVGYRTAIHNLGRVGAISLTTPFFAQCSAYLDYQSTHSTEVLDEYYEYNLQYDVVTTKIEGSIEVLKDIRDAVRSSFDKAFEDAIGRFYADTTGGSSTDNMWHAYFKDNGFKVTGADMRTKYQEIIGTKASQLYDLEKATFPLLP